MTIPEEAWHDPYSFAMRVMKEVLEFALDDGVSGAMNDREFATLDQIARLISSRDPAVEIEPRGG